MDLTRIIGPLNGRCGLAACGRTRSSITFLRESLAVLDAGLAYARHTDLSG